MSLEIRTPRNDPVHEQIRSLKSLAPDSIQYNFQQLSEQQQSPRADFYFAVTTSQQRLKFCAAPSTSYLVDWFKEHELKPYDLYWREDGEAILEHGIVWSVPGVAEWWHYTHTPPRFADPLERPSPGARSDAILARLQSREDQERIEELAIRRALIRGASQQGGERLAVPRARDQTMDRIRAFYMGQSLAQQREILNELREIEDDLSGLDLEF